MKTTFNKPRARTVSSVPFDELEILCCTTHKMKTVGRIVQPGRFGTIGVDLQCPLCGRMIRVQPSSVETSQPEAPASAKERR